MANSLSEQGQNILLVRNMITEKKEGKGRLKHWKIRLLDATNVILDCESVWKKTRENIFWVSAIFLSNNRSTSWPASACASFSAGQTLQGQWARRNRVSQWTWLALEDFQGRRCLKAEARQMKKLCQIKRVAQMTPQKLWRMYKY